MIDYTAFKKPFQDIKTLIILIIIQFIPILGWMNKGYFLECGYLAIYRRNELPNFKEASHYLERGFTSFVIQGIYLLPVVFVLWKLLAYFFELLGSFNESIATSVGLASIDILYNSLMRYSILGGVFLFLGLYVGPVAVLNYRLYGKFSAAFSPTLLNFILKPKYLLYWFMGTVYLFGLLGIAYWFMSITYWLSYLLIPIALVIGRMTLYYFVGNAYSEIYEQTNMKKKNQKNNYLYN
jgi:hypothetical protein